MHENQHQSTMTISYTVVERYIEKFEQKTRTSIHEIILDSYKITSAKYSFQLDRINDISYKPFSGNNGLLYLHTDEGVFTFLISVNPNEFINMYKMLRNS